MKIRIGLRPLTAGVALAACMLSGKNFEVAQADEFPKFDPGIAALAARLLTSLKTVPFDGSVARYRGYMFDVRDRAFDEAYAHAMRDVPARVRTRYRWIGGFEGVSGPNELLADGSKSFVYASICMAHNCPDHTVYAFFDPEAREVWGVVNIDRNEYPFGIKRARDEAIVDAVLGRAVATYGSDETAFPLSGSTLTIARRAVLESDGTYSGLFSKIDDAMMGH